MKKRIVCVVAVMLFVLLVPVVFCAGVQQSQAEALKRLAVQFVDNNPRLVVETILADDMTIVKLRQWIKDGAQEKQRVRALEKLAGVDVTALDLTPEQIAAVDIVKSLLEPPVVGEGEGEGG